MKPFITRFGERRQKEVPLPGSYCEEWSVWTIQTEVRKIPLVRARTQLKELLTKTEVERERDDADTLESELRTKTFVERERDDGGSWISELMTKTRTERERED